MTKADLVETIYEKIGFSRKRIDAFYREGLARANFGGRVLHFSGERKNLRVFAVHVRGERRKVARRGLIQDRKPGRLVIVRVVHPP